MPNEADDQGYTEGGDDKKYNDDDDYHQTEVERENDLLQQRLDEALQANEELARQLQQSQRNPPGRPKKKSSRRKQATETWTALF